MGGCFRQNQMQGRVNKNVEDKVRITHQGIEYLKGLNTAGVKE
jgi:hypothetical protein